MPARFLAAVRAGAPGRAVARGGAGPAASRRRRSARSGSPRAAFAAVDDRAGLDRAVDEVGGLPAVLKTRRGGYDGKGQRVLRVAADVDGAWAELGGVPLILEAVRAVRPRAVGLAVRGRRRRRWRAGRSSRTSTSDGILRVSRAPAPGLDAALQRRGEAARRRACSSSSTTSACSRSSCSTSAASCWPTRSHRGCTTPATGRSRAPRPASSRTTSGRCSGWPLGSTDRAGPSAMLNCIGDDARPRRGARGPGRAPARLRQGAAARAQARPRHRRPRDDPTS